MGGKVTLACRSAERGQEAMERLKKEALEKPVSEVGAVRCSAQEGDLREKRLIMWRDFEYSFLCLTYFVPADFVQVYLRLSWVSGCDKLVAPGNPSRLVS